MPVFSDHEIYMITGTLCYKIYLYFYASLY